MTGSFLTHYSLKIQLNYLMKSWRQELQKRSGIVLFCRQLMQLKQMCFYVASKMDKI